VPWEKISGEPKSFGGGCVEKKQKKEEKTDRFLPLSRPY